MYYGLCCFVQNLCQDLWKLRILYTAPSQKLTDGQAVQHYVNGLVLDMMIHILYCQLVVKDWNSFSYFVFFIGVNRVSNSLKNIIHKEIYMYLIVKFVDIPTHKQIIFLFLTCSLDETTKQFFSYFVFTFFYKM